MSDQIENHKPLSRHGLLRLRSILAPKGPIPVSRSTLYAWIAEGKFPRPIKLSDRVAAWRAEDVLDFLKTKQQTSPADQAD